MTARRVVVTGYGAVSPFGIGADPLWDGLVEGRAAVSDVSLFDTAGFDVHFGGEIPDFKPEAYLDRKLIKRLDRFVQFAMVAAGEAVRMSGFMDAPRDPLRMGVVFGSGIGGLNELEQQLDRLRLKGPDRVSAFTIPKLMVNAASGNISIEYGARGPTMAVSSACASATNAMGEALRYIRMGLCDVMLTGGSEAALTPLALSAFAAMKALSTRNDDPLRASRPFDKDRDGFVLAEGAGALVFEELEHARQRGAHIYAEVIGFGSSSDAQHIAQPPEDGVGAAEAMRVALRDAQINPEDVNYINAHATGTPLGDVAETVAIKSVFGPAAQKVTISSTKGAVGHSLGASGGVELIAAIRGMENGVIPPTVNLDEPGEGCDLDYCPNTARDARINVALSNSFGFGGHNACIAVRRFTS